jgi:hypothetical protein
MLCMTQKFCYWTVADGKHALMAKTMIKSARKVGVTEDFYIWTDLPQIEDAIVHSCGQFNKHKYLFKFQFLLNQVKKLDYEYFVFLDTDNYFVRHPGETTYDDLLDGSKIFCQMENDCTSPDVKRGDWWSMPIKFYPQTLRYLGAKSEKIYNTNAGFWIVKKKYIKEFYHKAMDFWLYCKDDLGIEFTEEAPLAFAGHVMQKDVERSNLDNTSHIWASDWTGVYKDKLPDGTPWQFEDYMTGQKKTVNPAIVHAMRSKDLMVQNG